jgi:hypothetical protein
MQIDFEYIKPLLRHRFSTFGMALENTIMNELGRHYFDGDKVTWEHNRQFAYQLYHKGHTVEQLAYDFSLPCHIIEWWISIWTKYDNAWGFIND